jgi:2',3'-cyclic-nucleotide 2'-phosphodiesterase (5'-nucleotidase family)
MSIQHLKLTLFLIITIVSITYNSKQEKEQKQILRRTDEKTCDIAILHVNDVHCGVDTTIGYDGFVLYREMMKKECNHVITVDVGDHVQGGTLGAISEGEAIIQIMNQIKFDAITIGNHEFDYGTEQLAKLGESSTTKYISSNFCYNSNKSTIFQPYTVVTAGEKKIGFIGVVTPLTFSKTYLVKVMDGNGKAMYDFRGEELATVVQDNIDKLKTQENVDYVFLLTHLGMGVEQYTSDGLLSKLEKVDGVFDGHTHSIYIDKSKDKNNKEIPIAQTGTKLESIGKLIIKTDRTLESENIKEVPQPSSDITGAKSVTRSSKTRWVDETTNTLITNILSGYDSELKIKVGHSNFDLIIKPEGSTDSHSIYCRVQECTVGDLIADAVNKLAEGNFALVNGGGVRNNMKKGDITRADVIEALPWFNNVVVKKLTGQTILDALEFGVRNYPKASGGFPQISSELSFDFNPDIESTVEVDKDGLFVKVSGNRRVSNVKLNGKALDKTKTYEVTLLEFTANGGDGYSMIGDVEVYKEGLLTDTDAVTNY